MSKSKYATLQRRILSAGLISTICEIVLIVALFAATVLWLRSLLLSNNRDITQTASRLSASSLEAGIKDNLRQRANDLSSFVDEKFSEIESLTWLIAACASEYSTNPQDYKMRRLNQIQDGVHFGGDWRTYTYLTQGANRQMALDEAAVAANIGDIFELLGRINSDITSSYLAGESGYFLIARGDTAVYDNYQPHERTWYKQAIEAGKLIWSDVYAGIAGSSVTCAAPYYGISNGQRVIKGVAGLTIALEDMDKIIKAAMPGEDSDILILTKKGEKLFASDGTGARVEEGILLIENAAQSDNAGLRALAVSAMARENGEIEAILDDGTLCYLIYYPLSTLEWTLCIIINENAVNTPVAELSQGIDGIVQRTNAGTNRAISVMLVLLTLLFALIVVYRIWSLFGLAKRIASPLSEFARQTEAIGTGDFTSELNVDSRVIEINRLAKSFNEMRMRLREYIKDLAVATSEWQKVTSELDLAAKIQTSILPSAALPPPKKSEYGLLEVDAVMYPAKEVGGDLYDYFFIGGNYKEPRFAIVAGDVSGKGLSAAMLMLIAKTLIKTHLTDGLSIEDAVDKLNSHICAENHPGMFVTLWAGVYDADSHEIEYVNAGHMPPLVKSDGGDFHYLQVKTRDIVVGVMDGFRYHKQKLKLERGSELFLYTDGITEAFNKEKEMYGEERLLAFLNAHKNTPLKALYDALHNELKLFAEGIEQSDDITMLSLRVF